MKIAAIYFYLNTSSGSANSFLSTVHELIKQGHIVDVYTYYYDPEKCFPELVKNLKITYVHRTNHSGSLSVTTLSSRIQAAIDYFIKAPTLYGLLKKKPYDFIFCSESCSYSAALEYKKRNNIPVIWSVFDPITLIDKNKPNSLIQKYPIFGFALQFFSKFDTAKIKQLDAVLVPTKKLKKQLDSFYGIRTTVLPTAGINLEVYQKNYISIAEKRLEKFGYVKHGTLLFSHAHFQPHRRYEDILEALSSLVKKDKNIKLLISGNGKYDTEYFTKVTKLITTLHLNDYVIIDQEYKTVEELTGYYQLADIFIFACIEQTWGLAPFEAAAAQTPVILSSGVGCSEVFNSESMILVPPKSPEKIIAGVELICENKEIKQNLINNAYTIVSKNHTYSVIATKLLEVIKKVRR